MLVILIAALIVLGPDKLPNAARQVGKYLAEFRKISQGFQDELKSAMDITAVPEPVNIALGIFAGLFLVVIVARSRSVRSRVQHWRVAVVQWIDAV